MVTPPPPPAASEGHTLIVRDVYKSFQSAAGAVVRVLSGMTLTVRGGELVSVVGPSGCGKSTLLRMIAGLDSPTAGELSIGGMRITTPGIDRGLVFQDPTLFPWLTVRGNVQAGLVARGVLRGRSHEVGEYIRLVGLQGFEEAYPHQLSGGMAQRAALARALINRPAVLLLDEPLGGLDQFTRMQMQDEVLRIWQDRGTTIVLVTHDIDEALYMSDRIVLMTSRPGRVDRKIDVGLPRPRLRASGWFLEMRAAILDLFRFAGTGA